jgi:2-deoxy-D-gluconate 3-dehydrogenase
VSPSATLASPAPFAGEAALVTGASRGIGQAVALELARRGADVALVQRGAAEETVAAVEALGRRAVVVRADLAEPRAAEEAVEEAVRHLGRLDVLVANAGEILRKPALELTLDEVRRTIALNVTSVFSASRAAARRFLAQADQPGGGADLDPPAGARPATIGRIVHVASVLSFQGGLNVCAYAASKGAVAQLTRSLANEWAPLGIRVNAVAPGYVANEQTAPLRADPARFASISARIPLGRWAASEEIAGAVAFLASPDAGYVHGHVLAVDGGWLGR